MLPGGSPMTKRLSDGMVLGSAMQAVPSSTKAPNGRLYRGLNRKCSADCLGIWDFIDDVYACLCMCVCVVFGVAQSGRIVSWTCKILLAKRWFYIGIAFTQTNGWYVPRGSQGLSASHFILASCPELASNRQSSCGRSVKDGII